MAQVEKLRPNISFHILGGKKLFREMVEKGEPAQVIGCHRGIQELFVSFLQFFSDTGPQQVNSDKCGEGGFSKSLLFKK